MIVGNLLGRSRWYFRSLSVGMLVGPTWSWASPPVQQHTDCAKPGQGKVCGQSVSPQLQCQGVHQNLHLHPGWTRLYDMQLPLHLMLKDWLVSPSHWAQPSDGVFPLLCDTALEILADRIRWQHKETKGMHIRKEEIKLILFTDDMLVYGVNSEGSTGKSYN